MDGWMDRWAFGYQISMIPEGLLRLLTHIIIPSALPAFGHRLTTVIMVTCQLETLLFLVLSSGKK
eukprot:548035-Pelagomonas_calceolata.AAC.3